MPVEPPSPVESDKSGVCHAPENRSVPHSRLAEATLSMSKLGTVSPIVISGLVRLVEFLLVSLAGTIIILAYLPVDLRASPEYWVAVPGVALMTIIIFQSFDLYHVGAFRTFTNQSIKVATGYALVFLTLFAIVFFLKLEGVFSRVVFGAWFVVGLALLLLERMLVSIAIRNFTRRGLLDRRTAIVGGGDEAARLIDAIASEPDSDIKICGVFDDRNETRSPDIIAGFPKLGSVDDLIAYARHTRVDLIIFSLPVTAEARILSMLRKLWVLPVDIRLAAHTQKLRFRPRNYSFIGSLPMFDMADNPVTDWNLIIKAIFDRVIGTVLLVTLAPLMLLIAIAVKLDSRGPVLFRQKRYGFNNQMVEVLKFRSMFVEQADPTAAMLVTKGDTRVTRVGRILRKASLDELPQLFNVVFGGELSLVGPRPHAVHAKAENRLYDEVVEGYYARHKVRPGITGWAQVNGWRGETDSLEKIQKRVQYDLYYIENWSVFFDLQILMLTPFALINSENAY